MRSRSKTPEKTPGRWLLIGLDTAGNKRGRPALGSAPASVESVRLDPELRRLLLDRAEAEGTTTSELIREALRRYLRAA